jgi:octopine/nopaline transport system permease protein
MNRLMTLRRIIVPQAYRQALPAYGNELILMIKATSLASIITIMEVTGIAAKVISETYRAVEVFIVAGTIYLIINFVVTRLVKLAEYRLTPHLRVAPISAAFRERA